MKKVKEFKLITASLFAVILMFSYFSMNAFAASASSTKKSVTINGVSYSYWSTVETNSLQTTGFGVISTVSGNNVPTGYMGVESNLYNSAGTSVDGGAFYYNSIPAAGIKDGSAITNKSGTYYSKARMQFYNGNGYSTYTSYASPNVQFSLASIPVIPDKAYEVNENGLSYGSDFYSESQEDSPDLIRVIGKNGIEGYVYSKNINLNFNNLSEVLDHINTGQSNYTIPVYKVDGTTVVDTFEITRNEGNIEYIQASEK